MCTTTDSIQLDCTVVVQPAVFNSNRNQHAGTDSSVGPNQATGTQLSMEKAVKLETGCLSQVRLLLIGVCHSKALVDTMASR